MDETQNLGNLAMCCHGAAVCMARREDTGVAGGASVTPDSDIRADRAPDAGLTWHTEFGGGGSGGTPKLRADGSYVYALWRGSGSATPSWYVAASGS